MICHSVWDPNVVFVLFGMPWCLSTDWAAKPLVWVCTDLTQFTPFAYKKPMSVDSDSVVHVLVCEYLLYSHYIKGEIARTMQILSWNLELMQPIRYSVQRPNEGNTCSPSCQSACVLALLWKSHTKGLQMPCWTSSWYQYPQRQLLQACYLNSHLLVEDEGWEMVGPKAPYWETWRDDNSWLFAVALRNGSAAATVLSRLISLLLSSSERLHCLNLSLQEPRLTLGYDKINSLLR